jgi:aryl-alcohol dehydrogenase-like predicted oxidoreductase
MAPQKKMPYGTRLSLARRRPFSAHASPPVRLGSSGLKVSKIILGCMSYGTPDWQKWVLPEQEAIEHIRLAYDAGIQTFDTANVYSNGLSEVILGRAIRQLALPRDEIVVMTKVFFTVARSQTEATFGVSTDELDQRGYANQHGLSRKVRALVLLLWRAPRRR